MERCMSGSGVWLTAGVILLAGMLTTARADTMEVGSKKYEGSFEGFAQTKFIFRVSGGKLLKTPRSSVRRLTLAKPRNATMVKTARREPESIVLVSYGGGGKFTIMQNGRKSQVFALHVTSLSVAKDPPPPAGGGMAAGPSSLSPIDTSGVKDRPDLSRQQVAALARYQIAREAYDAFVAESSAMVAEMDTAAGDRRQELLQALRVRKQDERPISGELAASQSALLAALPELSRGAGGGAPARGRPPAPDAGVATMEYTLTVPNVGPNGVFLIDTGFLTQGGRVSDEQSAAISRYNETRDRYRKFMAKPSSIPTKEGREALKAELRKDQKAMLKAFPNLKLVTE